MAKVVNDGQELSSNGKLVMMIMLDLSSAFDTIDQNLLLEKLFKMFKVEGGALEWIQSYLKERTFFCPDKWKHEQ